MKIIAGKYKNKKLISFSKNTQPTASMVLEAVFNMLYTIDGIVLDLFAGSGQYGFEALSRGASFVYFNDVDKEAYRSLLVNKSNLKLKNELKITQLDYLEALKYYRKKTLFFEIVFLDPPYQFNDEMIAELLDQVSLVSKTIVLERAKKSSVITISNKKIIKEKNYGKKKIIIYQ